jgi:hypothetical protein
MPSTLFPSPEQQDTLEGLLKQSGCPLEFYRYESQARCRRCLTLSPPVCVRLVREEGRDVSSQYGRRDEACPASTGGRGGGTLPTARPDARARHFDMLWVVRQVYA